MAISSLLVNSPSIPQSDHSWLDGIAKSLGGVVDSAAAGKIINEDLARSGVPTKQSGGWLSSLLGGNLQKGQFPAAPAPANQGMPQPGPVAPASRSAMQGDTYQPFINTVKAGGLTNPYGLAAVASTGKAESGWSAANANRTWSDPSESGQPGTAGGIMSWRGPRYQALAATGDLSPEGQAKFFLQENPDLIAKLNNAGSVEEAQQLMNNAWAFAGHDRPGGESARRLAMAQNYYSNEFGNAPNGGAAAIEASAPLEQGDTSGAQSAYVDPMVKVQPQASAAPYTMASPTAPDGGAPTQVAGASGRMVAQPQAQSAVPVDGDLIRRMVQNPITRERGMALWQQAVEGRKNGFDFMMAPNGDLLRTDKQGGASVVGNFAKPNEDATVVGENLVRRSTGEVIYEGKPKTPASYQEFKFAQQEGFKGSYADWEKVKTPGGTNVTVNNQDQSEFSKKAAARNVERFGNLADAGTAAAGVAQSMPVLRELLTQAPQGPVQGRIAEMLPGFNTAGDAFMSQVNQIAPTLRVPGSGAMSDKDMDILMSSLPRLRSDPSANQLILNVFEKKAQLNADRGGIAAQALRGEITPEEADRRISEIDKTPLLDERSRAVLKNGQNPSTPQAQSSPATNGALPRARNPKTGAIIELRNGKWEEVR